MSAEQPRVETINELNIWLDGQFKLIGAAQHAAAEEISRIRDKVHETANHVSGLMLLNIPDKLQTLATDVKAHDTAIESMGRDMASLKTVLRTAYISMGIAGTVFGALATLGLQMFQLK